MPGKVLPDNKIEQWIRSGKTNAQIVKLLEEQEHIKVTRQAISAWRKRRGDNMNQQSPRAIPWTLRPEHRQLEPARVIRLYAKRERGEQLSPEDSERLNKALRHLDSVGGVFTYEPDTPQGWWVVARRPGVDRGIIREP